MRLISKEDLGQVGRVSFAGKSFDSVVRLAFKVSPGFKVRLCNSYLGFSLPYLVCLFL